MYDEKRFDRAAENLLKAEWIFAKTMPRHPHWYTLRKTWDNEKFVDAVLTIRQMGYDRPFYSRLYRVLHINGMRYWTMGNPIDIDGRWETTLINRTWNGYQEEKRLRMKYLEDPRTLDLLREKARHRLDIKETDDVLSDELRLSPHTETLSLFRPVGDNYGIVQDFYSAKRYDAIFAMAENNCAESRVRALLKPDGKAFLLNPETGETRLFRR